MDTLQVSLAQKDSSVSVRGVAEIPRQVKNNFARIIKAIFHLLFTLTGPGVILEIRRMWQFYSRQDLESKK